jgi:DNA-binding LacI/PurR family transcriptional regulator
VRKYVVKPAREPAMTDVAKLAGVSHQTVSRVLNGHPNVRQRTRIRVQAAITELGYRPNRAARSLATGTSQVIGFVTRSSTLYGPASMVSALAEAALEHGFAVNVESVRTLDRKPVADAISRLLDQRVAGLVVIVPVESANDALDDLPDDIPIVNVDGDPRRPTELVTVDQEAGARAATEHLLAAGHRTDSRKSSPLRRTTRPMSCCCRRPFRG